MLCAALLYITLHCLSLICLSLLCLHFIIFPLPCCPVLSCLTLPYIHIPYLHLNMKFVPCSTMPCSALLHLHLSMCLLAYLALPHVALLCLCLFDHILMPCFDLPYPALALDVSPTLRCSVLYLPRWLVLLCPCPDSEFPYFISLLPCLNLRCLPLFSPTSARYLTHTLSALALVKGYIALPSALSCLQRIPHKCVRKE